MLSRGFFLRAMIGCLIVTAIVGAGLVFVQNWDVIGRFMGTTFIAALAAGMTALFAGWVDDERKRRAGLVAMAWVVTLFALAVAAIWSPDDIGTYYLTWRLWYALVAVLFCGIWIVMCLRIGLVMAGARRAASIGMAFGLVELAWLQAIIWMPDDDWIWHQTFAEIAAGLAAFGVATTACLVGWGADRRHWRWLGVAAAGVGFVMTVTHAITRVGGAEGLFVTIWSIAAVTAYINMTLRVPLRGIQVWIRRATIAAAIVTAACVDAAAFDPWLEDLAERAAAAAGIVTACGTLVLLILARLNRGVDADTSSPLPIEITLHCPRCQKRQSLPVGEAACAACGLRITTKIEEPRCAKCGYLLYNLRSASCPECGEPIATPTATAPPSSGGEEVS